MDALQSGQEPPVPGASAVETSTKDDVANDDAPAVPQTAGEADQTGAGPSSSALPPAAEEEEEEEEDPLVVAQRNQEEQEKALEEALNIQAYDDVDMRVRLSLNKIIKLFPLPLELELNPAFI
jgi:hypothetical protein